MKKIHNPHDKMLFLSLENKEVAKSAMEAYLPQEILAIADLNKIKLYKTKFVTPEYKAFEADVLYEVPLKEGKGLFMLHCEHQSTVDKNMPIRIWQYLFAVLSEHKQNNPNEALPVIWPIIIYTGKKKYTASTNFFDLFGDNKALAKSFMLNEFKLVDVCRLPDEDIKKHSLFGLAEFAFKHKNSTLSFDDFIKKEIIMISEIAQQKNKNYAKILITYIINEYENGSVSVIEEAAAKYLTKPFQEDVMTIADQLRQEGMQQGMQQGKIDVAKQLLKTGLKPAFVAQVTQLPLSKVKQLIN